MKKRPNAFWIVIAFFMGVFLMGLIQEEKKEDLNQASASSVSALNEGTHLDMNDTIVVYKSPLDPTTPIMFVHRQLTGKFVLKINLKKVENPGSERWLTLLKEEAVRICDGKFRQLGDSGIAFQFTGKYIAWGPYGEMGPGFENECLHFANDENIRMPMFSAKGPEEKPHYYPY